MREKMKKIKEMFRSNQSKNGSYTVLTTAIVIGIVIVLHLIIGKIPTKYTKLDMSDSKIYSIGEVSKDVINKIDKDIVVTVLVEDGSLDTRIGQFLESYSSLSSKIHLQYVDPVLHPTALKEYDTTENTIVVSCEETGKKQIIEISDMIQYNDTYYYYYGQTVETAFDGEGQMTSAIDYVINENTKKVYVLEGHNEETLSNTVLDLIDKANMNTEELDLMTSDSVPEDCSVLIVNAPSKDFADDEKEKVLSYLQNGGNVFFLQSEKEVDTPNIDGILVEYGLTPVDGYIADTDRFYGTSQYNLLPVLSTSSEITSSMASNSYVLLINAKGLEKTEPARDTITVTPFMETSSNGYAISSNGKTQGTYILGATAVETINDEKTSQLTVITSNSMIDEQLTSAFSNLENLTVFMNGLINPLDDVENISIEAKSLEVQYNTFANTGFYSSLFIFIIPIGSIIIGLGIWIQRKRA